MDGPSPPAPLPKGRGEATGAFLTARSGTGPGVKVRGAALLMALFVAAIATLIVSGLFWRQFVLVRTIENQQLLSQSRLLLRGALDWARAILREDAAHSNTDTLSEPWAQPLAETRLDQLGESSALASQATMSGSIEDAQSRLNLHNLVHTDGSPDEAQREVLTRLAAELSLPGPTADLISAYVVQTFAAPGTGTQTASGVQSGSGAQPLPLVFPEDVARVPGLDPAVAPRLAPYVVVLDARTPVNFNTASAEVIAAEIGLSLSDARALVADRDRIPFVSNGDVRGRLRGRGTNPNPPEADASVSSSYFFIRGEIKLQRADTRMEALVKRASAGQLGAVDVLWEREL
jgi:general secretion pathway protein K